MSKGTGLSLEDCFADLPDPRIEGRCDHKLLGIIIIAICAVLCGADSWVGIETVGKAKASWFRQFLKLEYGIPSHDTFGYVFARINHEEFQQRFMRWVESVFEVSKGQVIALDGKTLRGSQDKMLGKEAIHLVSAWASENGLVLGQRKVADTSNEMIAIPELLRLLDVSGCIVTIDAMGCQTKIAQVIRDEKKVHSVGWQASARHKSCSNKYGKRYTKLLYAPVIRYALKTSLNSRSAQSMLPRAIIACLRRKRVVNVETST